MLETPVKYELPQSVRPSGLHVNPEGMALPKSCTTRVLVSPPATGRRYVAYVPAGDLVESARYRIGLVNALPTYFAQSQKIVGQPFLSFVGIGR